MPHVHRRLVFAVVSLVAVALVAVPASAGPAPARQEPSGDVPAPLSPQGLDPGLRPRTPRPAATASSATGSRYVGPAVSRITRAPATFKDINPDQSDLDPFDPDGASGGRVNGLATVARNNRVFYAATEWGGLYKTTNRGRTWFRLNGHVPVVTWDVEVDPGNPRNVYATSFYDGRVKSRAGINLSRDRGVTWRHPRSATPPAGFDCDPVRRSEPSAFGIAIRPDARRNVFVGTNCGLARSTNAGRTWTYVDPSPATPASDVWDVVAQQGGIIDVCGDDGHLRSIDNGATWTAGNLPFGGQCSIAASPDESYVLFAVVGTTLLESDDAGLTWTPLVNPFPQGRVPFVATNQRSVSAGADRFDLWFGDVSLARADCVTPASPSPGGSPRCPTDSWNGPFTRAAGAHDDAGDLAFDSRAGDDACPLMFSSDGGVYRNTDTGADCHSPKWEQPDVSPHATWLYTMDAAHQAGVNSEDLYFGLQDNGAWASRRAGASKPSWHNAACCDVFDMAASPQRVLFTLCCFGGERANRLFIADPGITTYTEVNAYPPGDLSGFRFIDILDRFSDNGYVLVTTSGVFVTHDITANPIAWIQLGTGPADACGVKASVEHGTPVFYVQAGSCNPGDQNQLWKYTGTAPAGTWTQVNPPGGGFGIFDVDPTNPQRLYASNLQDTGPRMIHSEDGGSTWSNDPALDRLMTGGGVFKYQNQRGPTDFTGFGGYPQPSLVAFDPKDSKRLVAGGRDSGVFLTTNGGKSWKLLTNPFRASKSGPPHLPRPWFANFDHDPAGRVNLYIGTQGRGVWRIKAK
jgi:photosystem II stability/assembly factor-like uncharacterized protein